MKNVAVVTATRAEYGILSPIIRELRKYESLEFKVELIVTGTHLSDKYGMTINEVSDRIDYEIRVPVESESEYDISKNQADVLVKFTELFVSKKYSAVVLLGDRYEMLAIAIAAGNTRTPIFHLCGGDTTEGAIDEWIRHSITKISYLHFVTNFESRKRVIQLGEDPSRVFNYGSTSIDNILSVPDMSKTDALTSIHLPNCRYALCTYHPETLDNCSVDYQINEFMKVIQKFKDLQFIVTKSNADLGGARINELLDNATEKNENLHVFSSLGIRRYLSLMKSAEFVLGNSSSGIIEAPVFHVPTVNIGDRQRGRLQAESIINCGYKSVEIEKAIKIALSCEHRKKCQNTVSPYGTGHSSERIAKKIFDVINKENICLKKKFYECGRLS